MHKLSLKNIFVESVADLREVKNIVVVGAWNIAIFTPEWMKKFALNEYAKFNMEVPLSTNASLRFTTDDFIFAIVNGRLELMIKDNPENAIVCLRSVLQKLIHTPITAMGVNYKFQALRTEFNADLWDNLFTNNLFPETTDEYKLTEISNTAIYQFNEFHKLRLVVLKNEADNVSFDFNFDFQLKTAEDALKILQIDNTLVEDYRNKALNLLKDEYNLNIN